MLLAGLYVIAGGIRLTGDLEATPATNTGFLAVGSVLASFLGTTGASMLLIRPLLQTNRERTRVTHTVVFFIFLVSNVGGMLTPLGDPPLFLGYLKGVPFTWTFRLWLPWLVAMVGLLLLYFIWDSVVHAREPLAALRRDRVQQQPLRLAGRGQRALAPRRGGGGRASCARPGARAVIVGAGRALPLADAPRDPPGQRLHELPHGRGRRAVLRHLPHHDPGPRAPADCAASELGVREPWQFFWATGILSSFLDNAPTYLTFLALGQGLGLADEVVGVPHAVLAAISTGAVFMGANTYIGNAPELHGEVHRRGGEGPDAELLRLHAVQRRPSSSRCSPC